MGAPEDQRIDLGSLRGLRYSSTPTATRPRLVSPLVDELDERGQGFSTHQ